MTHINTVSEPRKELTAQRKPPSRFAKFMVMTSTLFALTGSPSEAVANGGAAAAAAGAAASAAQQRIRENDSAKQTSTTEKMDSTQLLIMEGALLAGLILIAAIALPKIRKKNEGQEEKN